MALFPKPALFARKIEVVVSPVSFCVLLVISKGKYSRPHEYFAVGRICIPGAEPFEMKRNFSHINKARREFVSLQQKVREFLVSIEFSDPVNPFTQRLSIGPRKRIPICFISHNKKTRQGRLVLVLNPIKVAEREWRVFCLYARGRRPLVEECLKRKSLAVS